MTYPEYKLKEALLILEERAFDYQSKEYWANQAAYWAAQVKEASDD